MVSLYAALDELDRLGDTEKRRELLELRCKTLITLALSNFLVDGVDAGLAGLKRARELVDLLEDDHLLARLEYQRANILGRAGHLAGAWDGLEGAVQRLDAFTAREQCSVYLSRGMLAFELGRPGEALTSFEKAAELASAHGFVQERHMAVHNQGYATYLLGDIPGSLSVMAQADEIDADVSHDTEALDRARVLLEAGLVSDAVSVLVRDRPEASERTDHVAAEFDLELARAHRLLGQLPAAAASAAASRDAYARLGASAWEAKATLAGLGVELERQRRGLAGRRGSPLARRDRAEGGSLAAAARTADALTTRAVELGDPDLEDQARVVAGEALLLAGDIDGAKDRLLDPRRSAPGSLADELNAAAVTASLHVAAGERAAARRLLSSAVKRLAAGQQGSASLDLRTARAVHGVRLAAIDLDLALPRGSAAVLETLERWRSATDRLPSLGRPTDERLAELTEQLRSVRAQHRNETSPAVAQELQHRATRLEQQIRARDWALSSRSYAASTVPVRVREGRDELNRSDRDLIWLFAHGARLCGVGVINGRAALRDLMPLDETTEVARRIRLDLRAAATQHLGPLSTAVWRSLESGVARLDDALVRPWRAQRQGLVLVTTPEVSALPWALCPSLVGRPLTLARSLTSFTRSSSTTTASERLGDNRRGHTSGSTDDQSARVHVAVGPGLPRAAVEADAVADSWRSGGALVEVADPSTGSGLVQALARSGVVHVAAHGTHQLQSPLFSSLTLHDGPVFAHELQPTGVAAEHVVLSACDVGSASFRPGDEQLGLAASMLSLGADSVVASIAPIPDDVAATAMMAHHEALARGAASDEALANAVASTDPVAAAFLNLGGRFTP